MGQSCRKPIGHSSTRSSSALIIRALCSECALMAHHLHNPILVKREVELFGSGHTEHKGELVWSPNNTLTKRETQKPQLDSREIHVRKRCLCNWPNMSIVLFLTSGSASCWGACSRQILLTERICACWAPFGSCGLWFCRAKCSF